MLGKDASILMGLALTMRISALACMAAVHVMSADSQVAKYSSMESCSSDQPYSVVSQLSRLQCSLKCTIQSHCSDFNFDKQAKQCSLYIHKPLFYETLPSCSGYKASSAWAKMLSTVKKYYGEIYCRVRLLLYRGGKYYVRLGILGISKYGSPVVPSTIPSECCAIPFTLNGAVHHKCANNGAGVAGCFYGDRQWKNCHLPADFEPIYVETSTTALSANPAVSVPLLTINGWMLMQRKVTGGSVSFNQNWAAYRDGFGSAAGNDNYWLGLDQVYRLTQMGGVRLRFEIQRTDNDSWYSAEYSTFSISDEATQYQLTVAGYSGDAGDALAASPFPPWMSHGRNFSTPDVDNDSWPSNSCASDSGWWYNLCSGSAANHDNDFMWAIGAEIYFVQSSRILVKQTA